MSRNWKNDFLHITRYGNPQKKSHRSVSIPHSSLESMEKPFVQFQNILFDVTLKEIISRSS